jgi:hypothetical protein
MLGFPQTLDIVDETIKFLIQKPAEWPHYAHDDFDKAISKEQLEKVGNNIL